MSTLPKQDSTFNSYQYESASLVQVVAEKYYGIGTNLVMYYSWSGTIN